MMRVASGRASGVKRGKSMMRDQLAVATPDKGRGQQESLQRKTNLKNKAI